MIYKWTEENSVKFTEEIFEQLSHGKTCDTTVSSYKGPTRKEIGEEDKVRDPGSNHKLKAGTRRPY